MKTLKGPGIFLAQFASDSAPFNTLEHMARWAANLGYKSVQIPSWDKRLFDLETAAVSKDYCAELQGVLAAHGLVVSELATHLQGQLVATHPAYDELFEGFAPAELHGKPQPVVAGSCDLLGRVCLASVLSLAAAAGWADRRGVRGARAALAAHS